jgi:hypothetical protein
MNGKKRELVNQPNADVLLEVVGYGTGPTGSKYLRNRLFFPFRPIVGDEVYFDGDAMKPATVMVVDWFIHGDKSSLQVRLESQGLDDKDIECLIDAGWVEHEDPTSTTRR